MRFVALSLIALIGCLPAHGSVIAEKAAVSSPETLSTAAGLNVLRAGGTAADAAVATAFTLSVLRPDSVGIGGGGTAIYFDAATGEVWALDFRPAVPNPSYLENATVNGSTSLGVPGFVAGLGEIHRKFGDLKWRSLVLPAIELAKSRPDSSSITEKIDEELLIRPIEIPSRLNGESSSGSVYAGVLERIAAKGADEPYLGEIAERMIAVSRANNDLLTPRALAEYAPRWRSPVRIDFRGEQIYSLPSPFGAGNVLAEMVSIVSGFDWKGVVPTEPRAIHILIEAARAGWSENRSILADRGTVVRPDASGPERLAELRRSIERGPIDDEIENLSRNEMAGFVIIDERGNVAVLSLSLGPPFGSGVLVDEAFYLAEVPRSGAPSSSLPMVVLRDGAPVYSATLSGPERASVLGGEIYLENRLMGAELEQSVEGARFVPDAEARTILAESEADLGLIDALNAIGHGVKWTDQLGVIHLIDSRDSIVTISDPRGGTVGGY